MESKETIRQHEAAIRLERNRIRLLRDTIDDQLDTIKDYEIDLNEARAETKSLATKNDGLRKTEENQALTLDARERRVDVLKVELETAKADVASSNRERLSLLATVDEQRETVRLKDEENSRLRKEADEYKVALGECNKAAKTSMDRHEADRLMISQLNHAIKSNNEKITGLRVIFSVICLERSSL